MLLLGPFAAGALAVVKIKYAVAAVLVLGIIAWVAARPPVAAYLLIFVTPLVVGSTRASSVPGLRANEGLMVAVGPASACAGR